MAAGSLIAGIGVAGAAAVCNAFSVELQALEARQVPEGAGLIAQLIHRPKWLLGTLLNVAVWPLQIAALTLAPLTVVQPTLSTSLLLLLFLGTRRLGEPVGRRELLAALAIVLGVAGIVLAVPSTGAGHASLALVLPGLAVVGGLAAATSASAHWIPRIGLLGVIGSGLAYAWADFSNKLLAGDASDGHWAPAAGWLLGTLVFGALAFFVEQRALQRQPATTVAPIIAAIKVTVPVVLALAVGAEEAGGAGHMAGVLGCLVLVAVGAGLLARSPAVGHMMQGDDKPLRPSRPPAGSISVRASRA